MSSPKTTVVNLHQREECDVYIGRPGDWGNPFEIGRDGSRTQVLRKYREWLPLQHELVARIKAELSGKRLGCFCHPLPCHGHTLAEIANAD